MLQASSDYLLMAGTRGRTRRRRQELPGRPLAPREEQTGYGERDGRAHSEEKLGQVLGVPGARPTNAAAACRRSQKGVHLRHERSPEPCQIQIIWDSNETTR